MKSKLIGFAILIATLILLSLLTELGFRAKGYKTFVSNTFQMRGTRMEPKPLFNPDSLLGLKLDVGTYKIYYEDSTYWQTTNNNNGYRITSEDFSLSSDSVLKHIDIFGCSFTYGTGLADTQTYPFLLQKMLNHIKINNYAVPGRGMAGNLANITKQNKIDSNTVLIYSYIQGHDYKTNNANRKSMYPSRNFLKGYYFLYLNDSLDVVRTQYDYKPWPLIQYSAFLNFIEDQYLDILDDRQNKHIASKKAVSFLNNLCKKNKAKFIFVILTNQEPCVDMLNYCQENNIPCADLSVDISDNKYNLEPYDNHPNFAANKIYAQKLYDYLQSQKVMESTLKK